MYGGVSRHGALLPKDNFVPYPDCALQRRRFNTLAIMQAILMPWLLFVGTLWLLSFEVRYYHPNECWFLVVCGAIVIVAVLAKGGLAKRRMLSEAQDDYAASMAHEPTWLFFLALSCAIALIAAILLGDWNFEMNTSKYHSMDDLQKVTDVSPMLHQGSAFLDAGIIQFTNGSFIDETKSIGFKDSDLYCVAPVSIGQIPLALYHFWVVGINCCDPFGGSFWCGEAKNPTAMTGVRLMDDDKRAMYTFAVQSAAAEYKLQVPKVAIFMTWTEDGSPGLWQKNFQMQSKTIFGSAIVVHLICQSLAVFWVVAYYQKYLM